MAVMAFRVNPFSAIPIFCGCECVCAHLVNHNFSVFVLGLFLLYTKLYSCITKRIIIHITILICLINRKDGLMIFPPWLTERLDSFIFSNLNILKFPIF